MWRLMTVAVCVAATIACCGGVPCFAEKPSRPNIVLVFVDDLGWSDIGCYGNSFVETPNIDRLAADGVRFTDFYAAGAVCSPTRCALQAGQNQARIGITAHIPGHWRPFERVITPQTRMALPHETVTVAESLQTAGYRTGYIGKWHLGNVSSHGPATQGYDFAAPIGGRHLPGTYRVQGRSDLKPEPDQYRTEFETDLALRFIREQKNDSKPFFLMVSPYAVHIPLQAMPDKIEKYESKAGPEHEVPHPVYAAMIEHVDEMVARIVEGLNQAGLSEETMVVFTSDNGGLSRRYNFDPEKHDFVTVNDPLRDEKGSLYEGGIRVPLIVKYPPLAQPGSECDEPTISYDFFPTFVAQAGGELPANQAIDGRDLTPLLKDPTAQLGRDAIHFHYPHYHHSRPASAIRSGPWKLIEFLDGTGDTELYRLDTDLSEENNLAKQKPGRVKALQRQLAQWRDQTVARMPLVNPHYDPQRAGQWWRRRTGEPID